MRDLSRPVRSEVVEDDGIAVLDRGERLAVLHDDCRLHELVVLALVIGLRDRFVSAVRSDAFALGQRVICSLDTVIVVVSVHRVVAAADHRDLSYADLLLFLFEVGDEVDSALGRRVSSVEEAVDIDSVEAVPLAHLKKSVQMGGVAVHAAGRQKSENMHIGILHLAVIDRV